MTNSDKITKLIQDEEEVEGDFFTKLDRARTSLGKSGPELRLAYAKINSRNYRTH